MIIDCEQRSTDWLAARIGRVTASRMNDVCAKLVRKQGEAAVRYNYKMEIVTEMLTGLTPDHYVTPYMEWGEDQEILARTAYEMENDVVIEPIGFAIHPHIDRFGASPDGLVGDDGLVEIKCLKSANHLEYMMAGIPPLEFQPQMLAEIACTERQWVDFVSYDSRMPKEKRLFVRRFHRDARLIQIMEAEVVQFLKEVDEILDKLKGLQA